MSLEAEMLEQEIASVRTLAGKAADPEYVDADTLDPLRLRVTSDIALETGTVAKLRALPTWQRVAIVLVLAGGITAFAALATPRADFGHYPVAHMTIVLTLLFALTVGAGLRLLRPLHKPPAPLWTGRLLLALGIFTPFIISVIPIDYVGHAAGEGAAFFAGCGKCLGFGGALGLPILIAAFAVRRVRVDGPAIAALGGVAAGLTGNLTLQLHCPITDPTHLIIGHGMLLLVLGAAAALWKRS